MFKLCGKVPFNYRFSDPLCERYYKGNLGVFLNLTFEQEKLLYNVDVNVVDFIGRITNHVNITILDGKSCRTVGKAKGAWTRIIGDKELPYNKYGGLVSRYVIYFISFYDPIKDIQKFCLLKFPADTYTGNNIKGSGFDHVNCYLDIVELPIDLTKTTDTEELIIMAKNTSTKSTAPIVTLNAAELKGIVKTVVQKNAKGEKIVKKGHYAFYFTMGKEVVSGRFSKDGAYDCKKGVGEAAVELKATMVEADMMKDNSFGIIFTDGIGIAITKWDEAKSAEFTFGDKTFKGFPAEGQLVTVTVTLPKPAAAPAADGTVKRGPGRPKKEPVPVVVDDDEEEVVASDDDEEEAVASGDDDEEVAASDDDEEVAASDDDEEEATTSDDDAEEGGDEAAGDADDEEEVATSDDDEEEAPADEEEEVPTGPAFDDLVKKFKKDTKVQVKDKKTGAMVPAPCIVYFDGDGGVEKIKVKSVDAKNKAIEVYIFSTKDKATVAEGSAEWRCILLDQPAAE